MLPRRNRLTTPAGYRAVLRAGRATSRPGSDGQGVQARPMTLQHSTRLLTVHCAVRAVGDSPGAGHSVVTGPQTHPPRVGFVVSKAVGNSVIRHRVIRRLRAQVADRLHCIPSGVDVVVRARPAAAAADSAALGCALDEALARIGKLDG